MNNIPISAVRDALRGRKTSKTTKHFSPEEIQKCKAFFDDIIAFYGDAKIRLPKKMLDCLLENQFIESSDLTKGNEQFWRWTNNGARFFLLHVDEKIANRVRKLLL